MDTALVIGIIGLGVAIMAVVMAWPPLLGLLWGKPKIQVRFTAQAFWTAPIFQSLTAGPPIAGAAKYDQSHSMVLWCELSNLPVRNPILRALQVRRMPAEDVFAKYSILSKDGGIMFAATPYVADKTPYGLATSQRVRLTVSGAPFTFRIVTMDIENGQVFAIPRDGERQNLPPGHYEARVEVTVDAEQPKPFHRWFTVNNEVPYARWDDL